MRALGFIPNPNSAIVQTNSWSLLLSRLAASPKVCLICAAAVPPLTSTTKPFSTKITTGSSTSAESHDPSRTMVPFMVPSLGSVKIFPAGRLVSIFGRLQMPLSSNFQSRQLTSNVTFVPASDLTFTIRFRRSRLPISPMFFLMMLKSADIPPSVNISTVIPGMVATRAPSLIACRTALVWVSEYRVGAMTTCCCRIKFATGAGGSSP